MKIPKTPLDLYNAMVRGWRGLEKCEGRFVQYGDDFIDYPKSARACCALGAAFIDSGGLEQDVFDPDYMSVGDFCRAVRTNMKNDALCGEIFVASDTAATIDEALYNVRGVLELEEPADYYGLMMERQDADRRR